MGRLRAKSGNFAFPLINATLAWAPVVGTVKSEPIVWSDPAPQKVACIGGSVTWGYWLQLPILEKTYPDYLARLLGPGHQVRNYGFGGATAGIYPGQGGRAFGYSGEQLGVVNWRPDVIIGGLGINDCNSQWADPAIFEQGYRDLVSSWRSGGRNPSIWLWNRLTPDFRGPSGIPGFPGNVFGPSRVFPTDDTGTAINRPAIQQRLDSLSTSLGLGTVDAYSLLSNRPEWAGDGLHLIEAGLRRLAEINYCQVWEAKSRSALPRMSEMGPSPGSGAPLDETGTSFPWVELHNPWEFGICLDGLALDAGQTGNRFVFTNSTVLWPGERRVVFLSGKYSLDTTRNLHTNFTVSSLGGQIRLLGRDGEPKDAIGWGNWPLSGTLGRPDPSITNAIGPDSAHQRLVTSVVPANWQQAGFNASNWPTGTGGFGQELPRRHESQFARRWSCDLSPVGVWTLLPSSSGWIPQAGGAYACTGSGVSATVPSWITGVDRSWTAEVRLKINGTQTGVNQGFVIRGGTQPTGGAFTHLFIQSNRVVLGSPYEHGKVLSTEPNNDGYHTFRLAYHAPARRFFVWRDDVEITSRTGGQTRDSSRFNWLTMGSIGSTQVQDALIDYASYDLTGAYAPETGSGYGASPNPETRPLVTSPAPSFGLQTDSAYLVRIPFHAGPDPVNGIRLKLEYDDGFRAWINGTEVASCNAPATGRTAISPRDDSRSHDTVSLDLSAFSHLVTPGANVLAVQAFNANDSDGRFFIRAALDLEASRTALTRYFSNPSPGQVNGPGDVLLAYGWLIENEGQSLPVENPRSLITDSDFDGRSNLLEYAQGTDPGLPDAAPQITESSGLVTFPWRDDPEVGWRLMESSGAGTWRPAVVTAGPFTSASPSPGMKLVSYQVPATGGIYRLAAVDEPTMETWQARHFSPEERVAGILNHPDADPEGDGLPNYVEFAIASDPRADSSRLFQFRSATRSLALPDPGSNRGVTFSLMSSHNLSQWNAVGAAAATGCFIDPTSGEYRLEVTDPALPPTRAFMRLKFSRNPP